MSQQKPQDIFFYVSVIVRKINNFFILLILAVFYFSIVGMTALFLKLVTIVSKKKNVSYWEDASDKKFALDYFKSPY